MYDKSNERKRFSFRDLLKSISENIPINIIIEPLEPQENLLSIYWGADLLHTQQIDYYDKQDIVLNLGNFKALPNSILKYEGTLKDIMGIF